MNSSEVHVEVEILESLQLTALLRVIKNLHEPNSLTLLSDFQKLLQHGYRDFLIDLSQTQTVTSSGLGLIAYCHKEIQSLQGRLIVICSNSSILKIFQITQLDQFIQLANTQEEAVTILLQKIL